METVADFIFWGAPKSLQMATSAMKLRHLLLARKAMTNLDRILKSIGISLPTKVHLVKAIIFLVVMCVRRRRQWHPIPVLLPGKSHGWRSLVGCSPWGRKESDMIQRLHFHFSLLCTGEGNGNPPHCSCLENPRDGVTQSRTRLKWLSSSSSMYVRESWTIKKAEYQRINTFEMWCWRLLRVPWTAGRSNQSILKEIRPEYSMEGLMLKWKLQYFGHLMRRTNSLQKTLCWERLKARGEGDDRGWGGWGHHRLNGHEFG